MIEKHKKCLPLQPKQRLYAVLRIVQAFKNNNNMKKIFILIVSLCFTLDMWAQMRSRDEIIEVAQTALSHHASSSRRASMRRGGTDSPTSELTILHETPSLAIVGSDNSSFALIAKDANVPALWGYSDLPYDEHNVSPEFQWMLSQMDSTILSGKAPVQNRVRVTPVKPLIKTQWNQTAPYNRLMPMVDDRHCLTGCVPTALAQMLNYYKTPSVGMGTMTYKFSNAYLEQSLTFDFSTMPFDFNTANNYETDPYTPQQLNAVARLMYACGMVCEANYGPYETFAGLSSDRLCEHLGYLVSWGLKLDDASIRDYIRGGTPIFHAAANSIDSHLMILDGYDADGLFHVNYGWGGCSDGYYAISDLDYYIDPIQQIVYANERRVHKGVVYACNTITGDTYLVDVLKNPDNEVLLQDIIIPASLPVNGVERQIDFTKSKINVDALRSVTFSEGYTTLPVNLRLHEWKDLNLQTLSLPSTLQRVGSAALDYLRFKCLECNAVKPPVLDCDIANASSVVLFVPKGSVEAYRKANKWKECGRILPLGTDIFVPQSLTYDANGIFLSLDTISLTAMVDSTELHTVVEIPEHITYKGQEYTITAIREEAFRGDNTLKSITVPATIQSIGNSAFAECYSLATVTLRRPEMYMNLTDAFTYNATHGITLRVPYSALETYQNAHYIHKFAGVESYEEAPSKVQHIYDPNLTHVVVFLKDGTIDEHKISENFTLDVSKGTLTVGTSGNATVYKTDKVHKLVYGNFTTEVSQPSDFNASPMTVTPQSLKFEAGAIPLRVRIINLSGIVSQQFTVEAQQQFSLPFSSLHTGVYVIDINGQTTKISVR